MDLIKEKTHHPSFTLQQLQRIFDLASQSYNNPTITTSPIIRKTDQSLMLISGTILRRNNK